MFSLAYVILPFGDVPPAEAIARSLERFQRGRRGDIPDEWLRFHDETAYVAELHQAPFVFTKGQGLRIAGGESWYLDSTAITAEMERRNVTQWAVRFADIEPSLAAFVDRFLDPMDRHPVTGGFGQWLNPLGRWDWWELGGRFDGVITGQPRGAVRGQSAISSGPSAGRAMLESIEDAVCDAVGQQKFDRVELESNNNLELVDRLVAQLRDDAPRQRPSVLVLPPTSCDDELRWISNWPEIGPSAAMEYLGLSLDADWDDVVKASYSRFADHWAAGVAFHH